MINLNTGKPIRYYSANTKIAVVQKCVTPEGTYYRTYEAVHHNLNHAFEASAFGLPNEFAPSAPILSKTSDPEKSSRSSGTKQKSVQPVPDAKDGGRKERTPFWKKLFHKR